jgi:AP2-associated kinase
MLAFPMSKSTSDGKTDTPPNPTGLSVPEDNPRKHGARRTSITDMVQRFEAIGGKVRGPGPGPGPGPSVIIPKSTGLKMPTSSTVIGRAVDVTGSSPSSPLVSRFTASRVITPAPEESGPGVDSGKSRPSAIDLARAALAGQDQSKADMNIRNPVVGSPSGTPSRFTPGSLVGRIGPLDGLPASVPLSPQKPSAPLEEPRSPSPDKPYQGVGKLIDQWQRKTEADSPRAPIPRRGGYTPKRAGLVSGEVGKDS